MQTPWGQSDKQYNTAIEGIIWYTTPSHGGVHVKEALNAQVPASCRSLNGWYEEDCEWSIPALVFPAAFDHDNEQDNAKRVAKNFYPDAYTAITGKPVTIEESRALREREFKRVNADNWVVISAQRSLKYHGFFECFATKAGERHQKAYDQGKRWLVDAERYATRGNHGYVINPLTDAGWDGK